MMLTTIWQDAIASLTQWWLEGGTVQQMSLWLSGTLSVWLVLRTCVYRHYERLGRVDLHLAEEPDLLPSQKEFVERMVSRLEQFDLHRPGPLWAIRGRWGDGKSFLIRALQTKLENRSEANSNKLAVVYIDVWRHQSERDLHWAMVEAIFSNPEVLRYAFDAYPVMRLLLRHVVITLHRFFAGLTLKGAWLEVSMGMLGQQALPLMAQRDLEQVIARLRSAGVRTVVFLDEMDRATPAAAQAAIVLTRRSLNLPGLAVVMPYVEGQLEAKVFNPLQVHVPELYQTFIAHLANSVYVDSNQRAQRRLGPADRSLSLLSPEDSLTPDDAAPIGLTLKDRIDQEGNRESTDKQGGTTDEQPAARRYRQYEARLSDFERRALRAFDALTPAEQRVLRDQTQEKYLSLRATVPDMSASDAAEMLRFKTVKDSLPPKSAGEKKAPESENEPELEDAVRKSLESIHQFSAIRPVRPPTVRHLEGQFVETLDLVRRSAQMSLAPDELYTLQSRQVQVATAAVIAWLTAQVTS